MLLYFSLVIFRSRSRSRFQRILWGVLAQVAALAAAERGVGDDGARQVAPLAQPAHLEDAGLFALGVDHVDLRPEMYMMVPRSSGIKQ